VSVWCVVCVVEDLNVEYDGMGSYQNDGRRWMFPRTVCTVCTFLLLWSLVIIIIVVWVLSTCIQTRLSVI
jgi:hypothetical protein